MGVATSLPSCPSPLEGEGTRDHASVGIPLSLYIHFPWCVRKCPYCDFNSHALRNDLPDTAYVDALIRDLDHERGSFPDPRPLVSIFMGGGTPSLFPGGEIARLLDAVRARVRLADDAEITLEANPGTVDEDHFAAYRAAGVNRLSIGVQSFNAEHLRRLGRIHDPGQARRAVETARRAGFENVNLDLMYALPDQTIGEARQDLGQALALQPEHISCYHLTIEPNTEFHARPPVLPDADAAWAMQEQGEELLAAHGYSQYEVSAYSRAGRQCRHNRNYWEFGDYFGIGAGAHGKISRAEACPEPVGRVPLLQIHRRARRKHPRAYLESAGTGAAIEEDRVVPRGDLPFEFAMNALRLKEGFTPAEFESRSGLDRAVLAPFMEAAHARGWLEADPASVRPSASGRAFLNDLMALFLP